MADYDWVILGGSLAGQEAAKLAALRGARVALVLENGDPSPPGTTPESLRWFYADAQRVARSPNVAPLDWCAFQAQAALVHENSALHTPTQLMMAGVDVIWGEPTLTSGCRVYVNDRCLTTRKLLIALAGEWFPPDIPGIVAVSCLTPASLAALKTLPKSLLLLGSSPLALEIAQALAQWGVAITLLTPAPQLLPAEESMVSDWVAAELRAAGVHLHLGCQPTSVTVDAAGFSVHTEADRWTADQIVLGTVPRPRLSGLNLASLGVPGDRLAVNAYLQTRHPDIYACGSAVGSDLPVVARHQAEVAVNNALLWNRQRVCYEQLPYTLLTQPEFCRVGLTMAEAEQRYGAHKVVIYEQILDRNRKAQALGNPTGFCRFVTRRNGQLLGAHIVGLQASEWGQVMAIALKHRLTVQELANLPTAPQTLTDMLRQTVAQWESDRWRPGQWRRDWAENWFNWRRSKRR